MARPVLDEPPPLTPPALRNFPYAIIPWPITGSLRVEVGLGADESNSPVLPPPPAEARVE